VVHPSYAGGHFLINCLGLNDESIFQHASHANKQIAGLFDYNRKIEYLHKKLEKAENTLGWQDLELGNRQLLGFGYEHFCLTYHKLLAHQMLPIVETVMEKNLHIILSSHSQTFTDGLLKFWPNARVIYFTNYRNFIDRRSQAKLRPWKDEQTEPMAPGEGYSNKHGEYVFLSPVPYDLKTYWDNIRAMHIDWPVDPPTTDEEVKLLPEAIQQKLREDPKEYIAQYFNYQPLVDQLYDEMAEQYRIRAGDSCFIWDVENNFSNSQEFLKNFKKCRDWLNLPATDDQDLIDYFERWLQLIFN
jgi:hypothetical protein